MFCATSTFGISWQHLNHRNLRVHRFYTFHVPFHVRLTLHDLGISLPNEDGFSKVTNSYIKSDYYSICDDYGVNADEARMHGDWFYTTAYAIFGHEVKARGRSPPENLTLWRILSSICKKSKTFTA